MDKYGLVGYPLEHSFSKVFFNDKFKNEHIDAEYVNFSIPDIQLFKEIILNNPNLKGLNVTIPYKEMVIDFLDDLDTDARQIGAINVVKIEQDNTGKKRLIGYNSDIIGFTESIKPLLNETHQKALILGTGGASKAIFQGLKNLGIESTFVSRKASAQMLTYDDLTSDIMQQYTVIINCTPLGMYPHIDNCPPIPYHLLSECHLLYDLVYNPETTLFMQKGKEQGATTKNGLDMLHLQALAAWDIWQK